MNRATTAVCWMCRWTAAVLALAVASAAPSYAAADEAPAAEDVSRAESYAADAFAAYSKKDYDGAIVLYLKSLDAAPSANVLYNLARIYDTKVGDRELAMTYYRRYVTDPGAEPERVRAANERLRALRELDVVTGEGAPAQAAAGRAPPRTPERERKLSRMQVAGLVTGLTGLAGLGVGAGYGFAARSRADDAKDVCDGNACTTQRGVDAAHDATDAARIATISFIAGGALTAVGAALLVWGRSHGPRRDTASLSFAPALSAGSLGGQLSGRW